MAHAPLHITKKELSKEHLSGARLAGETSKFNLARTRTRGGLLGLSLELGEKGRQQTTAEFKGFAGRGTRGAEAQVKSTEELSEFRREEFRKDIGLAREKRQVGFQIKMDEINWFVEDAKKAAEGQFLSNMASIGLTAILVGFSGGLGLTVAQAVGIGSSVGAAIGGVPPSPLLQTALSIGGTTVARGRGQDEAERLRILANRNSAITSFRLSDDPREGFDPGLR